jgi:hypothetical protein
MARAIEARLGAKAARVAEEEARAREESTRALLVAMAIGHAAASAPAPAAARPASVLPAATAAGR